MVRPRYEEEMRKCIRLVLGGKNEEQNVGDNAATLTSSIARLSSSVSILYMCGMT